MTTTAALHTIAFDLVRDAADLMDAVDPGATRLTNHDYGHLTIKTRRVYTPERDTLTLIAYRGEDLAATVLAVNTGARVTARIHQLNIAGIVFTRRGNWGFTGIGRVDGRRRRFTLTYHRTLGWRVEVNRDEPTTWPTLDAAAEHIAATYNPTP